MIHRFAQSPEHDRWDNYFEPGETLLWQGQPEPGLKSVWGVTALSIFGIPILLACLATAVQGFSDIFPGQDGPWGIGFGVFLIAFSVPFLLAGLAMTFGTWLASIYGHRFVRYALTNKRACVAKSFPKHSIETYTIRADDTVALEQGRFDGVKFKTIQTRDSDGDKTTQTIGFDGIRNGREIMSSSGKSRERQHDR